MRRAAWFATAAVALAGAVTAALLAGRSSAPLPDRAAQWRQDIAYLARQLPDVHVDGLTGVSRGRWDATAASLERQVPQLSDGQVILGILRLVALLHDDETTVNNYIRQPLAFPLALRWVDRHLVLIAVPPAQRPLLGGQLESVAGHPVSAILAVLRPEIDYQDPGVLAAKQAQDLVNPYLLDWLGIISSLRSAAFTVRSVSGSTVTVRLDATPALTMPWVRSLGGGYLSQDELQLTADGSASLAHVPLPLYQQHLSLPYWLHVLTAQHAVYLKYNACVSTDGFQHLAGQALAVLRRHPDYRLIVDLRDNPGGDSQPFETLISGLAADAAINQRGRIFGLINQLTDSSAAVDAFALRTHTRAVMIGQLAEDPIDEYGNDNGLLKLPYQGLTVQYTTKVVNGGSARYGVPDIAVAPTVQQILAGDDPVLQAALDYGRGAS